MPQRQSMLPVSAFQKGPEKNLARLMLIAKSNVQENTLILILGAWSGEFVVAAQLPCLIKK
ncbi:hypothetical protein LguiA_004136 [Lonicera macranthoides]